LPVIPDYKYKYHEKGEHDIAWISIRQESGATSYYQYMNIDGWWYMMKGARTGAVVLFTFTVPVNTSDSTGWTNRAALTYTTMAGAFA